MTTEEILSEFFERFLTGEKIYSTIGTVASVNESERTCIVTPIDGGAELKDIRLQSSISNNNGFVQIPTIGSTIIVSFVNNFAGFATLFTSVDKVLVDTDLVVFNGGANDGMVKVNSLITKMNNLENDLNSLKSGISGWTPVPNDGGAALKVALTAWYGSTFTPTVKGDLENTKITQ